MATETSKVNHPSGFYKHPDSGAIVEVRSHPKFGSAQADGVIAQGYEFIGKELPKQTKEVEVTETETTPTDKPLSQLNKTQLLEKAGALGLDIPETATNKEIVALIKAKEVKE